MLALAVANSVVSVFPSKIAPAAINLATHGASIAGWLPIATNKLLLAEAIFAQSVFELYTGRKHMPGAGTEI